MHTTSSFLFQVTLQSVKNILHTIVVIELTSGADTCTCLVRSVSKNSNTKEEREHSFTLIDQGQHITYLSRASRVFFFSVK